MSRTHFAVCGQLYTVTPTDATSYAVAVMVIGVVALTACWLPARRASAISPLTAMKTE
jgi:putative ABC transport system permease protein